MLQADAFLIAARFREADADEWQQVLAVARHAGWAGPVVSEVRAAEIFALRKAGIEICVSMSDVEEGGITPERVVVRPI